MPAISAPSPVVLQPEPRKVLLVLPARVGDLVMATPFIEALFGRFPDASIHLLLNRHLYPLLEGSPWSENCHFLFPLRRTGEAGLAHRELLTRLRQQQFDLAVMLPNTLRSAWLCWRSGASRRVGFDRDGRRFLLTDPVPVPNRQGRGYRPLPRVDYFGYLAGALGCPHPGDQLRSFTTPECDLSVAGRLYREGVEGSTRAYPGPLVVLCPGAGFGASAGWAPERFAAVADHLVRRRGAEIVISPGPGEEPLAQAIQTAMNCKSHLLTSPCLTLGELKSLVARSDLLVGNDSGPRQLARAFAIPRVTVFGPTDPRWTETSHTRDAIVRVEVPCGPCHKKKCPLEEQVCMTRVSVEMVVEACEQQLRAAARRS